MTEPTDLPPGWCGVDDPDHDHDGVWWSAADEIGRLGRHDVLPADGCRPLPEQQHHQGADAPAD